MHASPLTSGILKRLGDDLDADPGEVFRALVERAHEACMARVLSEPDYAPAIAVTTETIGGRAQVSICDNGRALAPGEVRSVYAAIRCGRVGAVRRAIRHARQRRSRVLYVDWVVHGAAPVCFRAKTEAARAGVVNRSHGNLALPGGAIDDSPKSDPRACLC